MKRLLIAGGVILSAYFATGWYVVGSDEKAAVRRFGRMIEPLRSSGLHYEWPWPWSRIDRVNVTAVRTLSLGDAPVGTNELLPVQTTRPPAFLTGDKNILLLRASVQYRIHEEQLAAYLFAHADLASRLRLLVDAELTAVASQSGVDYLQTIGLAELNQQLTRSVRSAVKSANLGIEIDQVRLEQVEPPARVQADFLEVSNARSEAARGVHEARTAAEQKIAAATSRGEELKQQALQDAASRVALARGAASRFEQLLAQLDADVSSTGADVNVSRSRAIDRYTRDALQQALSRIGKRVVVDAREPIDLNLPGP